MLLFVGTATAQPGGIPGRPMREPGIREPGPAYEGGDFFQRMLPMIRMLNLSDDQRESIGDIMQEAQSSIENIRKTAEIGGNREDFLEIFSSSSLSVSEIDTLLNKRVDVMKDVNEVVASALVDIHNILTDEQLAALSEFSPGSIGGGRRGISHPGAGPH